MKCLELAIVLAVSSEGETQTGEDDEWSGGPIVELQSDFKPIQVWSKIWRTLIVWSQNPVMIIIFTTRPIIGWHRGCARIGTMSGTSHRHRGGAKRTESWYGCVKGWELAIGNAVASGVVRQAPFCKNHVVDSEFSKGTRIHKHTQTHLSNIRREALEAKLQKELPHTAKYITHPWADFPWSRSPQIGSVPKKWAFESPRRELAFRRRIVRYWRPLGRKAIEPGKQPQRGYIPSYMVLLYTTCLPGVSC